MQKEEENNNLVKEPYTEYGRYTYADYLTWEIDHMVELIKGKVFRQAAAGYFGLTMPVISVKPCHFERSLKVG